MNLNKHKKQYHKMRYDGNKIIKIGKFELYPILYLREFDFTKLSNYKSKKYNIKRGIYKYIGVSEDYNLSSRTSKWVNRNISKDNKIGEFLRSIMQMEKLSNIKELNKYLSNHIRVLRRYDTIEKAKEIESTLISINLWEQQNLNTICLNTNDFEVEVKNGKYVLNN